MDDRQRIVSFRVGGPIQNPAYFAGREEILRRIIRAMLHLQNVSLHGERRTGKTSLLLYLSHPDADIELPETHIPVYFNFQDFAEASAADVWQAIADEIAEQIKQRHADWRDVSRQFLATIADFLQPSEAPALFGTGFGRALAHLDDLSLKIHLLFDEFDQTARNPNLGDSFYDALRSLPTRAENISYVIASRTGLAALQPTYDKVSSPFFNIFTTVILTPFREDEVHRLIFNYFAQADLDFSLAEKLCAESPFLYDLTGYHPFFLQMLCYHLFARLDEPDWPRGEAQRGALNAFEEDSKPHFNYYLQVSSKEEQELIEMLATGQSIDWNHLSHIVKSLQDRCLIVQASSGWRLFSTAFAGWVRERQLADWYEQGLTRLAAGELVQARESFEIIYQRQLDYRDVADRLREIEEKEKSKRRKAAALLGTPLIILVLGACVVLRFPSIFGSPVSTSTPTPTATSTTLTPTSTATPIPPTPTPTATPIIPTPTLTDTPIPPTPTPTDTPIPPTPTPTDTPIPPTPTSTATPITPTPTSTLTPVTPTPVPVYPVPVLEPVSIVGCNVTFRWTWSRILADDMYFVVRLARQGAEPHSVTWTQEKEYTYNALRDRDYYVWEIAICQGDPNDYRCANELAVSEFNEPISIFEFKGCSDPSPDQPTITPAIPPP